jgi:hypothetical protein
MFGSAAPQLQQFFAFILSNLAPQRSQNFKADADDGDDTDEVEVIEDEVVSF